MNPEKKVKTSVAHQCPIRICTKRSGLNSSYRIFRDRAHSAESAEGLSKASGTVE